MIDEKLADLLLLLLDLVGLFGSYGLCSFFFPRAHKGVPAFRALFALSFMVGLAFLFAATSETLRVLDFNDVGNIMWPTAVGRLLFKSLIVGGLWMANTWLRSQE